MNKKNFLGKWWLANSPEKKLSGILRIDESHNDCRYIY